MSKIGDKKMRNLLIKAIREGNKEKVDDLLCAGVDVNVKDKNRWTPLMWASFFGKERTFSSRPC